MTEKNVRRINWIRLVT